MYYFLVIYIHFMYIIIIQGPPVNVYKETDQVFEEFFLAPCSPMSLCIRKNFSIMQPLMRQYWFVIGRYKTKIRKTVHL